MRVVVVGGGMGGLATALFSARHGHEVVIVDRDDPPPDGDADDLAGWERRTVVQAHFSHYFLARSTRILRAEAPDLLDALREIGVGEASTGFGPGYEHDVALTARRPVYEGMMRRFVEREPGVTLVTGSVRGLVVSSGHPPRVVGVHLRDDTTIVGDLVVDAGGRRTASGRWLRALGFTAPSVEEESCDRHYYDRRYRLLEGRDFPSDDVPIAQPLPYGIVLVFIGDNRTFSVAMALSARDPMRHRLREAEVFDRFLAALPTTAEWLESSEPIGDVTVMAGLSNRRRRLVVDDGPLVSGLALVGDASMYTNPSIGQGVSLTFWMAQRLADSVERVSEDPAGAAVAYESWLDEELGPRFERQLFFDRQAMRQLEAGLRGEGFLPPATDHERILTALLVLAQEDEEVLHRVRRVGHLLEHPDAYRDDPALVGRVEAFLAGGSPPPREVPLSRAAFESLVAG